MVAIAGVEGTVEDFSLRRTTLRDLDGTVHSVPNGQIVVASNHTRVWARVNLDIGVAYDTDIERASAIIDGIGAELAADPAWRERLLETPDRGAHQRARRLWRHAQGARPGPGRGAVGSRR